MPVSVRATLIAFALMVLTIPGCIVAYVYWDDIENRYWPIRYGYTLKLAVEVDGKPYSGSASYECTFLGFADEGKSTIYDVKGEALVVNLDSGRALVAPILGNGFCNLDHTDLWSWNKEFGRLSARFAVSAAVSEARKVAINSVLPPGVLIILDNRENPKALQFLDWRVPEVALGASARLKEFSVTATRSSATSGISQRLPWLADKSPREIRLENRWLSWRVQSFDYADSAVEITGHGVPLLVVNDEVRFEDVTRFFGSTLEASSQPREARDTIEARSRRIATRRQTMHTILSENMMKVLIENRPLPYSNWQEINTFEKAYRVSVIPWIIPERQTERPKTVWTWDPEFCIDGAPCFHLSSGSRRGYSVGTHQSHSFQMIDGSRYVFDHVSKRVYVINLRQEMRLDLVRDRSNDERKLHSK